MGTLQSSFLRFLVAGAANTLGTLALYMLFVAVLSPFIAWAVAFACGIVFVNVVYPRYVFRAKPTMLGTAGNTLYYVVSFLASESLLAAATHALAIGPRLAGFVVAGAMVPINFLVARFCFRGPKDSTDSAERRDPP